MSLLARFVAGALTCAFATGCASIGDDGTARQDADLRAYASLLESGFTGDVAIMVPGKPDTIYYGDSSAEDAPTRVFDGWPWASVSKQVIAVLVMREVEDGRLSLGSDVGQWIPSLRGRDLTVENLLRHRSDLPNPDDTPPDADGVPSFYTNDQDALAFCTGEQERPAEDWSYNNCDYIVLGAMLEAVTDSSLELLIAQGVGLQSGWINTSFLDVDSDRNFASRTDADARRIAGYGASAGLVGPLDDMLAFDKALLEGRLLGEDALARLWLGDPSQGYMALGQWVFEAPLAGCDTPVRIVERRGGIGKYQVRNIILPDLGLAMAMATDQPEFDFGEIWTGSGAMHDALAELACS